GRRDLDLRRVLARVDVVARETRQRRYQGHAPSHPASLMKSTLVKGGKAKRLPTLRDLVRDHLARLGPDCDEPSAQRIPPPHTAADREGLARALDVVEMIGGAAGGIRAGGGRRRDAAHRNP